MNADHFQEIWIEVCRLVLPEIMIYGTADTVVPYCAEDALVDGEYQLIEDGGTIT